MTTAQHGDPDAQNNLAGLFSRGEGVSRDVPKALAWASLASAQGHVLAEHGRHTLLQEMTPDEVEEANSLRISSFDGGFVDPSSLLLAKSICFISLETSLCFSLLASAKSLV